MFRFIKHFFQKRRKISPSKDNFKKMLFESKRHGVLAEEIINTADLEKRKHLIYTLYSMIGHVFPYSRTKIIAKRRVIGILQDLLLETIQAQIDEIRPMDEAEKNAVYTRILRPARESALINHDVEATRRLELRARLSHIIANLNRISKTTPPIALPRETTPDLQAELLH